MDLAENLCKSKVGLLNRLFYSVCDLDLQTETSGWRILQV